MEARAPSIRNPRSFYDVFGVAISAIAVMAAVLYVWHGSIVRLEMVTFVAVVFFWVGWAIDKILERSAQRTGRDRR